MRAKKKNTGRAKRGHKEGRKRAMATAQQHMKHVIMPKRGHTERTKEGKNMQKKRAKRG